MQPLSGQWCYSLHHGQPCQVIEALTLWGDTKAETLLDWIYRLQQEEGDPDLKVLIFTEFVPTQEMLGEFLVERGFSIVRLNGSMDMDERRRVQEAFAGEARILVSTDAGGEGLNLQFCHVVVNYDIPWNPMRLEQRIGRVDRIGQTHEVRALNLVLEGSVEHRVREVLEEKLAVILEEFGVDKTGDVLDSADAEKWFDDVFVEAILHPDRVEDTVEELVSQVKEEAGSAKESASVLGESQPLDPNEAQRLLVHPLPHWVERMTTEYVESRGGRSEKKGVAWRLEWPDGDITKNAVFSSKERWPAFLDRVSADSADKAGESRADYHFQLAGPRDIPFEHDDVRIYVDTLFVDGLLHPVGHSGADALARGWTRGGLRHDSLGDKRGRFSRLMGAVSESVPDEDARHDDWMKFAQRWGELTALALELIRAGLRAAGR
jgi:hypothetical protein